MPTTSRTVPAVLAGALLLTACGSRGDDAPQAHGARTPVAADASCPSEHARYGSAPPTGEPSGGDRPSGTPSQLALPSPDGPADNGVRLTGLYAWGPESGCAAEYSVDFEVTNRQQETATYIVTIGFLTAAGGAVDNVVDTVESIAPGQTAKRSVAVSQLPPAAPDVSGAEVLKVRSVPAAEASSESGPCPKSGVRLYADRGDAAMGLRVTGLHLVNCGSGPYEVDGYPELELLDEDHDTVDGVRILHGTDRISTGIKGTGGPRPVALQPGEAAEAVLAWRNTTQFGDPVNVPYVRVRAKPGARPVVVTPELDLGTTGQLGVGPWQKDETYRAPDSGTARPTPPYPSAVPPTFPSP